MSLSCDPQTAEGRKGCPSSQCAQTTQTPSLKFSRHSPTSYKVCATSRYSTPRAIRHGYIFSAANVVLPYHCPPAYLTISMVSLSTPTRLSYEDDDSFGVVIYRASLFHEQLRMISIETACFELLTSAPAPALTSAEMNSHRSFYGGIPLRRSEIDERR